MAALTACAAASWVSKRPMECCLPFASELRAQPRFAPKFWGVAWDKRKQRWRASYIDGAGRRRGLGFFVRGEEAAAALAVNAAICRAGLTQRRKTNPVVDGRPVPRP